MGLDSHLVYNIKGALVKVIDNLEELKNLPSGIYIVKGRKYLVD